jgi:hypothetical protein
VLRQPDAAEALRGAKNAAPHHKLIIWLVPARDLIR